MDFIYFVVTCAKNEKVLFNHWTRLPLFFIILFINLRTFFANQFISLSLWTFPQEYIHNKKFNKKFIERICFGYIRSVIFRMNYSFESTRKISFLLFKDLLQQKKKGVIIGQKNPCNFWWRGELCVSVDGVYEWKNKSSLWDLYFYEWK